jgi:SAM-dependent methyltransferase
MRQHERNPNEREQGTLGEGRLHTHCGKHARKWQALVGTFGIKSGLKVLDLGCGDGTTAARGAAGADVLGVDIARNLVDAGNRRAQEHSLANRDSRKAMRLIWRAAGQDIRLVVSLRRHVRPEAVRCGQGNGAGDPPRGRIIMGNWIPNDPTLVAQILKTSAAYTPPPPEGFISPMTWGIEANVVERFASAGVPKDNVSFSRDTYTFNFPAPPTELVDVFRRYYGPTMNAFEAAEKDGRANDLRKELDALFESQNKSPRAGATSIPATFLRVTVAVS